MAAANLLPAWGLGSFRGMDLRFYSMQLGIVHLVADLQAIEHAQRLLTCW